MTVLVRDSENCEKSSKNWFLLNLWRWPGKGLGEAGGLEVVSGGGPVLS